MANPNLLRLFATAVQVASTLSSEMRFTDLHAAFKMTCELQQYIANVSFRRSNQSNSTPAPVLTVKSDPDGPMTASGLTSSEPSVVNEDNTEGSSSSSSSVEQIADNPCDTQAVNNSKVASEDSTGDIHLIAPTDSSEVRRESIYTRVVAHRRHRLVALETLHPDVSSDLRHFDQPFRPVPCKPCCLRMGPEVESFATMACPACPAQPAMCSAQCFRWWHAKFPNLTKNDGNPTLTQEAILDEIPCVLPALHISNPQMPDIIQQKARRPPRGKNRRRHLQLSSIKRAGLRKRYGRRATVLRNTHNAVALDTSCFSRIYDSVTPE